MHVHTTSWKKSFVHGLWNEKKEPKKFRFLPHLLSFIVVVVAVILSLSYDAFEYSSFSEKNLNRFTLNPIAFCANQFLHQFILLSSDHHSKFCYQQSGKISDVSSKKKTRIKEEGEEEVKNVADRESLNQKKNPFHPSNISRSLVRCLRMCGSFHLYSYVCACVRALSCVRMRVCQERRLWMEEPPQEIIWY